MLSKLAQFEFPDGPPVAEPEAMECLQNLLLTIAEGSIGPRDPSLTILPPQFFQRIYGQAHRTGDTARAELSVSAAMYWDFAVRELAHELFHVVDGAGRGLNVLEEGAATLFGVLAQHVAFGETIEPREAAYREAFEAVVALSKRPLSVVKQLRATHGAIRTVTPAALLRVLPEVDPALASKLCARFVYPSILTKF